MERSDVKMILRDRRLRFLGHNMRHVEPITNIWMKKTLVTEEPGRWAKLVRADAYWLVKKIEKASVGSRCPAAPHVRRVPPFNHRCY